MYITYHVHWWSHLKKMAITSLHLQMCSLKVMLTWMMLRSWTSDQKVQDVNSFANHVAPYYLYMIQDTWEDGKNLANRKDKLLEFWPAEAEQRPLVAAKRRMHT